MGGKYYPEVLPHYSPDELGLDLDKLIGRPLIDLYDPLIAYDDPDVCLRELFARVNAAVDQLGQPSLTRVIQVDDLPVALCCHAWKGKIYREILPDFPYGNEQPSTADHLGGAYARPFDASVPFDDVESCLDAMEAHVHSYSRRSKRPRT